MTDDAYALDLRQFVAWYDEHDLKVFDARRFDIDTFARTLEDRGRVKATVAQRLYQRSPTLAHTVDSDTFIPERMNKNGVKSGHSSAF